MEKTGTKWKNQIFNYLFLITHFNLFYLHFFTYFLFFYAFIMQKMKTKKICEKMTIENDENI